MNSFQVIGPDNKVKFVTSYIECVPESRILKSMYSAGYKFKLDGKLITYSAILNTMDTAKHDVDKIISDNLISTKKSARIHCIETNEFFNKQIEAAHKYNLDPAVVSDSIRTGKRRSGYTFERVE